MNKKKNKRLSVVILLLSFLLSGCGRDIHSYEYLSKQTKNDLSEIYSVSYCSTIHIIEYIKHYYKDNEALKIHDKSSIALVYGVDGNNVENLVFVPSYRTSRIYKFALDSEVKYEDIVNYIQSELPTIDKEEIKAALVDYEIIDGIPIILGFPITYNDITTIYYTKQNEIYSYTIS